MYMKKNLKKLKSKIFIEKNLKNNMFFVDYNNLLLSHKIEFDKLNNVDKSKLFNI